MEAKITGKTRYRVGFLGKMILQVELADHMIDPIDFSHSGPRYTYWKDATFEDVQYVTTDLS